MKEGLDFFYLVCNQGEKLNLIEAEFGITGFAVIVKLLQKIYGEKGYYCNWNDDVALLFADRNCRLQGGGVVSEIVKCAFRRKFFDEEMFKKYGILTSESIQKQYFEAAKRRTCIEVQKEYLLLSDAKIPKNVCIISKNADRNQKNADRIQQSKVKESKATIFSKENICVEPETASAPVSFPEIVLLLNGGGEYPVYQEDIEKYAEAYPAVDMLPEFKKMALWCENNPAKRKTRRGIARFIANWLSRAQDKGGRPSAQPQAQKPRQNRFCNYTPSYDDETIAEAESLEREQRMQGDKKLSKEAEERFEKVLARANGD